MSQRVDVPQEQTPDLKAYIEALREQTNILLQEVEKKKRSGSKSE